MFSKLRVQTKTQSLSRKLHSNRPVHISVITTSSHCATVMKLDLPKEQITSHVEDSVVWASHHGLVYALSGPDFKHPQWAVIHAPFAALPVAFPAHRFRQAKSVQRLFNSLVDTVSNDEAYLTHALKLAAADDEFTARLLRVLGDTREVREERKGKEVVLGIHRSDYMLDQPSGKFLQVELNTIASSFGCLSSKVAEMHKLTAARLPGVLDPSRLPPNPAIDLIPSAIATAFTAHGGRPGKEVVVMVVQPNERNVYDQQWIQNKLFQNHGIRTVRLTLADIATQCVVQPDGTLTIGEGGPVASVFYYRAGYTPDDYPTEVEWRAREMVERSSAVKCPTVAYQLAGSKKVQQDLACPGVLERFTSTPADASALREVFAGLWSLDDLNDEATKAVVSSAISDPDSYVLKPQREGGGNNLYGEQLRAKLQEGNGLSAYILMQKIRPPPQRSVLVRHGEWAEADTLSELGIYGTFVRKGSEVLLNEEVGHLVRTKRSDSNEGGVAAGFAVLDSPYLVDV